MEKYFISFVFVCLLILETSCHQKNAIDTDRQEFLQCQLVLEKEHGKNFQAILAVERCLW